MGVEYKSNLNSFNLFLNGAVKETLTECGKVGVENIKRETPVDSGVLRSATYYKPISTHEIDFLNDTSYAPYVNFGTYKQAANPFFTRGLANSVTDFSTIIVRGLRV